MQLVPTRKFRLIINAKEINLAQEQVVSLLAPSSILVQWSDRDPFQPSRAPE